MLDAARPGIEAIDQYMGKEMNREEGAQLVGDMSLPSHNWIFVRSLLGIKEEEEYTGFSGHLLLGSISF